MSKLIPWQELSLREQVSQLLVIHVTHEVGRDKDLDAFFREYPVGGVFAGGEVIEDGTNSFEHVRDTVAACQAACKVPLLVSADLENGCGDVMPGLTPLPWPMALGAAGDPALARKYAEATVKDGQSAGINWSLSPMADLNLHPLNSNVGTRAFGDDADKVIPLLDAYVDGMQKAGMAACAKTFPGDGSDYRDQHVLTTMNQLSREDWDASYGKVFQHLINQGVATIMTGHLSAPAIGGEQENGRYLPCTLSYDLTTRLLKQDMGYKGAIVSDAFGMGGILSHRDRMTGALEAFAAGADLLLWPGLGFIDACVEALEAGRIPMSRLEDALERIWVLKERYVVGKKPECDVSAIDPDAVSAEVSRRALTLLHNHDNFLPLSPEKGKRILFIPTTMFDKTYERFSLFREALERRGFEVDQRRNVFPADMDRLQNDYDVILIAVERQFHRPLGPMDLFSEDARNLWACNCHGWNKLVAVGFGSPYLVPWYFESARAAVNAYSVVPAVHEIVAAALCGEADFPGSMPVSWQGGFGVSRLPR